MGLYVFLLFIGFNCSCWIGGTVVEAQGDEMTRYEHAFVLRSCVVDMYKPLYLNVWGSIKYHIHYQNWKDIYKASIVSNI